MGSVMVSSARSPQAVPSDALSLTMNGGNDALHNESTLWKEAVASLSIADQQMLDFDRRDKLNVLSDLLVIVNEKRNACLQNRWKFKNRKNEDVILRDVCEKMSKYINRFKDIGDLVAQGVPVHAMLPWAAVRFILNIAISDFQTFGAMLEGMEKSVNIIARYSTFEKIYLPGTWDASPQLSSALTKLYASILVYLANAKKYYTQRFVARVARSVFRDTEKHIVKALESIDIETANTETFARLVRAQMQKCSVTKMDTFDVSILGVQKSIQGVQNTLDAPISDVMNKLHDLDRNIDSIRASSSSENELLRLKLEQVLADLSAPLLRVSNRIVNLPDNLSREEKTALFAWLSTIPHKKHYKTALKGLLPGSGAWLRSRFEFVEWRGSSISSILWLHGIPGSGKSKLVSMLIQMLLEESLPNGAPTPLAYFYCSKNASEPLRTQAAEVLRCILKQLACLGPNLSIRDPVVDSFRQHQRDAEDDGSDLLPLDLDETVDLLLRLTAEDPAIIIIDALDECDHSERHALLSTLCDITSRSDNLVKVFVASRENGDIAELLAHMPDVRISAQDNMMDLARFVRSEVQTSISTRRLLSGNVREDLQDRIVGELIEHAQGMFLWVKLQIQNICDYDRVKIEEDIDYELCHLTRNLTEVYALIYGQISRGADNGRSVAQRCLKWILAAQRKLSTKEFLAMVSCGILYEPTNLSTAQLLALCCNLVTHDAELDTFRFIHGSVSEFLETRPDYTRQETQRFALTQCLSFYSVGLDQSQASLPINPDRVSIETYAAYYWPQHYANLDDDYRRHVWENLVRNFMYSASRTDAPLRNWMSTIATLTKHSHSPFERRLSATISVNACPLLLACTYGFLEVIKEPVGANSTEIREKNRYGDTALHLAIENGHLNIVTMLLDHNIDVNLAGADHQTPLYVASLHDRQDLLKLLLKEGAKVDIEGGLYGTPLQAATAKGNSAIVEELLKNNADPNRVCGYYGCALNAAVAKASMHVVGLLIRTGARHDIGNTDYSSSLKTAVMVGREDMVIFLIKRNVDLEVTDDLGRTALHLAVTSNHYKLVDLLLGAAAKTEVFDWHGRTPLFNAASSGNCEIAELLMKSGAETTALETEDALLPVEEAAIQGHWRMCTLLLQPTLRDMQADRAESCLNNIFYIASVKGDMSCLDVLILHGAKIKIKWSGGRTILHEAASRGHLPFVKWVLEKSAIVWTRDDDGQLALHEAAVGGHVDVISCILEKGLPVNWKNGASRTALHEAAWHGQGNVVQDLLNHGANPNMRTNRKETSLHFAALRGHLDVTRKLCDHGADIDARNISDQTPQQLAESRQHRPVVECLIEVERMRKSAIEAAVETLRILEPDAITEITADGSTGLHNAVLYGSTERVQALASIPGLVRAADKKGRTPLHLAARHLKPEAITILIRAGADTQMADEEGNSPFNYVAEEGNIQAIEAFLSCGLNVDARGADGMTMLEGVATNDSADTAAASLINHGADLTLKDSDGDTIFHTAAYYGHISLLKLLLRLTVDPETIKIRNNCNETALGVAASNGNLEILKVLLHCGFDALDCTKENGSALHAAARGGHLEVVDHLLQEGIGVNTVSVTNATALHVASQHGRVEVVKALLDAGADCYLVPKSGYSALLVANMGQVAHSSYWPFDENYNDDMSARVPTKEDFATAYKLLWDYTISRYNPFQSVFVGVSRLTGIGRVLSLFDMPLHRACRLGDKELIRSILDSKDDKLSAVNRESMTEETPVAIAASEGSLDIVRILVQAGANIIDISARLGHNALYQAAKHGHFGVVRYLIQEGAQVVVDPREPERSALYQAAKNGYFDIAEYLIDQGAEAECKGGQSLRSYIEFALQHNDFIIVPHEVFLAIEGIRETLCIGTQAFIEWKASEDLLKESTRTQDREPGVKADAEDESKFTSANESIMIASRKIMYLSQSFPRGLYVYPWVESCPLHQFARLRPEHFADPSSY